MLVVLLVAIGFTGPPLPDTVACPAPPSVNRAVTGSVARGALEPGDFSAVDQRTYAVSVAVRAHKGRVSTSSAAHVVEIANGLWRRAQSAFGVACRGGGPWAPICRKRPKLKVLARAWRNRHLKGVWFHDLRTFPSPFNTRIRETVGWAATARRGKLEWRWGCYVVEGSSICRAALFEDRRFVFHVHLDDFADRSTVLMTHCHRLSVSEAGDGAEGIWLRSHPRDAEQRFAKRWCGHRAPSTYIQPSVVEDSGGPALFDGRLDTAWSPPAGRGPPVRYRFARPVADARVSVALADSTVGAAPTPDSPWRLEWRTEHEAGSLRLKQAPMLLDAWLTTKRAFRQLALTVRGPAGIALAKPPSLAELRVDGRIAPLAAPAGDACTVQIDPVPVDGCAEVIDLDRARRFSVPSSKACFCRGDRAFKCPKRIRCRRGWTTFIERESKAHEVIDTVACHPRPGPDLITEVSLRMTPTGGPSSGGSCALVRLRLDNGHDWVRDVWESDYKTPWCDADPFVLDRVPVRHLVPAPGAGPALIGLNNYGGFAWEGTVEISFHTNRDRTIRAQQRVVLKPFRPPVAIELPSPAEPP